MQYLDILSSGHAEIDLAAFAAEFFERLQVKHYEERESSNYLDGHYFRGNFNDILINLAMSDDGDAELPYWIQFSANTLNDDQLVETVRQMLSVKLHPMRLRFVRMNHFGTLNEERTEFM